MLNVSHPARTTASTTDGIETPSYDGLNRTTKVTHPDAFYPQTLLGAAVTGSDVNTTQLCSSGTYGLGYPVLYVDEAGKKRETWKDGFGKTIEADEPDSSGNLTSNTCYKYDALGNLLQIVHGTQTRTYVCATLSRVTSVTITELADSTGTHQSVTYTYDSNSNLQTRTAPAPNQQGTATVTTTYFYDALNRLTKISYGTTTPVATPTVQYGYDGTPLTGCSTTPPTLTDSNPKGRRTSMCDGSGATSWAHYATGKILTEKRITMGVTETISYSYNGTVTGITNIVDSNGTQSFTYDPLNRILSAQSAGTSAPDCWGQVFGPDGAAADDAVANLTKINSGTQTQPTCPYGMLSAAVDANNHIHTDSTFMYDTAGNMTEDGKGSSYWYTFDAENRLG